MIAPHTLTATQAAAAMRQGQLTSVALVRSCLDRIAAREPEVRAWAAIDPAGALAQAERADTSPIAGPLHGIPIGLKDVIDTADLPTAYGSPLYDGFRPNADARCVTLLRAAGAIILGKTETVEFAAAGRIPPTRNPRDLAHTPGGSSSGSAAAVADTMLPLALGTQTGGSTIRPAAFTGIFALKPTFGTVPRDGVRAYAPSLDTVGWFARSIADLGLVADAFRLPADPDAIVPAKPRIGLCRGPRWQDADGSAQAALGAAERVLAKAGFAVDPFVLDPVFDRMTAAQEHIMYGEGAISFRAEWARFADKLHPELRDIAANTRGIAPADLREALDLAAACRLRFEAQLKGNCDAVLTLAAPGEPPAGLASTGEAVFNKMWTALGVPCLAVPCGSGPGGLPVGLQLLCARHHDRRLLALGQAVADRLSTLPSRAVGGIDR